MHLDSGNLITFIVPAYNVEKYIAECLDSLVNQSRINHKIVIVNDGSTDSTEIICKEYANRYPDLIKYVYQDNLGLGGARNTGLTYVDTPYVTYLDSDDWQNTLFVEKFEKGVNDLTFQVDIFFTLPWIYDNSTNSILPWMDKTNFDSIFHGNYTNRVSSPELYGLEVNACRKIYRTDFLRELNFQFSNHLKWEDVRPHFQLLHRAQVCYGLQDIGFYYRTNTGNQITAGGGASRMDMLPVFEDLLDIAARERFDAVEYAYVFKTIVSFTCWSISVTNTEYIIPLLKGFHKIFRKLDKKIYKNYLRTVSSRRLYDRCVFHILRSPFYKVFKDYLTIDKWQTKMARFIKKIRRRHDKTVNEHAVL